MVSYVSGRACRGRSPGGGAGQSFSTWNHSSSSKRIVTALERGGATTRWREFADVLTISGTDEILASQLRAALETVAAYRGTTHFAGQIPPRGYVLTI